MILSVIVPLFNEEKGLIQLFSKLQEIKKNFNGSLEFIFVDDGSLDDTHELVQLYKHKYKLDRETKFVRHPDNKGLGAAIRTGVANADGKYIAVIDSDCSYDPKCLIEMLKILKKNKADIITASPYHPQGAVKNVSTYRLWLSKYLSKIYRLISKFKLYTYTSMFRIYRADLIKRIKFEANDFLAMVEIVFKAYKKGAKIIEFPMLLDGRKYGKSKAAIFSLIKEHSVFIKNILIKT